MPARVASTVLTTSDACALYGKGRVQWMVRSGRWQRPAKGVVVCHSGPLSRDDRLWCELLIQGPRAALAGLTAAGLDGLTGFSSTTLFILAPRGGHARRRPGVVVRSTGLLTERDVHPVRAPRRTRTPRSIIDAAVWADTDLRAQAIIAASVQQGLVSPPSLAEVADERGNVFRHQLIGETIRDVGGGSLSEYELLFLQMCRRFKLPTPTRQRRRKDATGRWRYLDVDFDEYDLSVEIDGQQHMEALAWWEDMMRNNDLVVDDGKWLLRFAGFALRRQTDRVAEVLQRFFDRHPPNGRRA